MNCAYTIGANIELNISGYYKYYHNSNKITNNNINILILLT